MKSVKCSTVHRLNYIADLHTLVWYTLYARPFVVLKFVRFASIPERQSKIKHNQNLYVQCALCLLSFIFTCFFVYLSNETEQNETKWNDGILFDDDFVRACVCYCFCFSFGFLVLRSSYIYFSWSRLKLAEYGKGAFACTKWCQTLNIAFALRISMRICAHSKERQREERKKEKGKGRNSTLKSSDCRIKN